MIEQCLVVPVSPSSQSYRVQSSHPKGQTNKLLFLSVACTPLFSRFVSFSLLPYFRLWREQSLREWGNDQSQVCVLLLLFNRHSTQTIAFSTDHRTIASIASIASVANTHTHTHTHSRTITHPHARTHARIHRTDPCNPSFPFLSSYCRKGFILLYTYVIITYCLRLVWMTCF